LRRVTPPVPPDRHVELVLHIGSGKTGTSSIQHFLSRNRESLAQVGTLVPREAGDLRHLNIGLYIKPDEVLANRLVWRQAGHTSPAEFREGFRERLKAEIHDSGLSRVVLSDEGVYASSRMAIRNLRRLVNELAESLRVVVYLRRQDDHLCSSYQQTVKTGYVHRLSQWVLDDMSWIYDYARRLRQFARILAPVDLVVRRFEPGRLAGGSLLQDFLDAAGIDARAHDLRPVPQRNQSLDAESVEFLRLLNLYRVEHEGATPGLIGNRDLVRTLMRASSGPTLTLPESTLDEFMARWEESNRAVAQEFLHDPSGVLFASPRRTSHTTTHQGLEPDRLPRFLELLELPEHIHRPLLRLAEREATAAASS
jgi:hypothetical protein